MELSTNRKLFFSIYLTAFALLCSYFLLTPSDRRQYDSQPHVEYIRKIVDSGSIPQTTDCWQCYHPPIYYLTAASLFRLLPPSTPSNGDRMLQRMALILFLSFELIGLTIILPLFPSGRSKLTAGILFALWPSGIIHSARIGNDLMLYPVQAASLYFLLLWRETKDTKRLYAALALALICSLIKFNGLLSLVLIVLISLYDGWREHHTIVGSLKKARFPILVSLAGFTALILYQLFRGAVFSNAHQLMPFVRVTNSWGNLLRFDLANFLTAPFINLHHDTTGRQLFFNYWLKSAIFGEFQFPGGLLTLYTAAFAAASLLMLLLPLAVGYLKALRDPKLMVFAIDLTIWLVSAWLYRFNFAYAPSSDFRYSYPAIISAVVLITEGCRAMEQQQDPSIQFIGGFYSSACFGFIISSCWTIMTSIILVK